VVFILTAVRSFLIALEGVDGAGKTTQAERLAALLRDDGAHVSVRSFPAYGSFVGREIRRLLREGAELDARSAALWFAVDRAQALRRDPPRAEVEILNRYTLSNAVYQSARGPAELFDWVLELEHGELGLPRADLTFVLDVTPELVRERVTARAEPDGYERLADLQARVRAGYLAAAERLPDVVVVACDARAPDEIAAELAAAVRARRVGV
jgi:dTMP kinase